MHGDLATNGSRHDHGRRSVALVLVFFTGMALTAGAVDYWNKRGLSHQMEMGEQRIEARFDQLEAKLSLERERVKAWIRIFAAENPEIEVPTWE